MYILSLIVACCIYNVDVDEDDMDMYACNRNTEGYMQKVVFLVKFILWVALLISVWSLLTC